MSTDEPDPSPQPSDQAPAEVPRWELPIGRRAFLGTVFTGIGALVLLSRSTGVSRVVSKVTEKVAPSGGWRIYAVQSPMPVFDPDTFRLRISGEVEEPLDLSWEEVREWTSHSKTSDFHCVTGWSVLDVRWRGILPEEIVAKVKPTAKAKFVTMQSLEEPYFDQVTMEQFMHSENILVHTMDDEPLTREHGSPLRMILPEMYGYKGVKWLTELRFEEVQTPGYWEQRGYDVDAYVGNSNGIEV